MAGPLSTPDTSSKAGTVRIADPVWDSIPTGDSCDLDAIAERTGLAPARLLPRLFDLELRGLVRRVGGGRFVRVDRSC
jgi:predicted Rossmann fold nucleotide-binding protein DprA/Smf involved in DNA uptake